MAFLTVPGFGNVPVAVNTVVSDVEEIGDRARAFEPGTILETIRGRRDAFVITTAPMARASADSLESALGATPPLGCSGDLLGGTVNCHATAIRKRYLRAAAGERVVVTFTLVAA